MGRFTCILFKRNPGDTLNSSMPLTVGIVVIGRNEGDRLVQCLKSLLPAGCPVVYVDSGSADGSAATARAIGADVIELDHAKPFSAARGRNEGFGHLFMQYPEIGFVQFLDADCTLLPDWIAAAVNALLNDPKRSAVVGHLMERNAGASVYNRLCAMEWRSSAGDLQNYGHFGGISMIRAKVFHDLGGFRTDVIAGEDSELGVRMGLAGYKITKLDISMATHDAGMTSFRQWWRRAVRAGHAIGQRYDINGRSAGRDCERERRSTIFWGIGLPLMVLALVFPTQGLSLLLLVAYPALGIRIWHYRKGIGDRSNDAAIYAIFTLVAKFANAVGLLKFLLNRRARKYEIIEYK